MKRIFWQREPVIRQRMLRKTPRPARTTWSTASCTASAVCGFARCGCFRSWSAARNIQMPDKPTALSYRRMKASPDIKGEMAEKYKVKILISRLSATPMAACSKQKKLFRESPQQIVFRLAVFISRNNTPFASEYAKGVLFAELRKTIPLVERCPLLVSYPS